MKKGQKAHEEWLKRVRQQAVNEVRHKLYQENRAKLPTKGELHRTSDGWEEVVSPEGRTGFRKRNLQNNA